MTVLPESAFRHLVHLTGPHGLFEHAEFTRPRVEHGYCTDDNARLLVVTSREPDRGVCAELSRHALSFVLDAQDPDGRIRNRRDASGRWTDEASTEDCWGRSLWALGVAASQHEDVLVREQAAEGFEALAVHGATSARTMAFAALGAVEIISIDAEGVAAKRILTQALAAIGPEVGPRWNWPEARLAYANAALAEAVIAAGAALDSKVDLDRGLRMLGWLLARETRAGHLSVAPAGGSIEADRGPQFDQQPIEVAALADACARAHAVTGDSSWLEGVALAAGWFDGANDVGVLMYDPVSGGSFDGLQANGVNLNQGAESALAYVSTQQRAVMLVGCL